MAHQEALQRIKGLLLELRLAIDELEEDELPPPPANVVPMRPEDKPLTGIIGRPMFKTPNGKSLWVAGIGVSNGQGATVWVNAIAWGILAEFARDNLHRGELIQVEGREKQESYIDGEGVMRHKTTFVINRFLTGESAGSAATPSRDRLNATT